MYDVYLSNKKVGSGQVGYINTAYVFYKQEGFDVVVIDE